MGYLKFRNYPFYGSGEYFVLLLDMKYHQVQDKVVTERVSISNGDI